MQAVSRARLARVLMLILSLVLVTSTIVASPPAGATVIGGDPLAQAASAALGSLGRRGQAQQAAQDRVRLLPFNASVDAAAGYASVDQAVAEYAAARAAVARHAAPRAGLDPAALDAVWAATDDRRMLVVLSALSQVGVPYRRNSSQPGVGFDCSGLIAFAWGAAGVGLPRNSSAQLRAVPNRPLDQVQPGDLVQYPGHVMLSLGLGTAIVHASHRGTPVEVRAWSRARQAGNPLG